MNKYLQIAINHFGSQNKLAHAIGEHQSKIHYWRFKSKKNVPYELLIKIQKASNGEITPEILVPSLYGLPKGKP